MEYCSAKELAEKWGVTLRYVQRLAANGRIQGAKKCGNSWVFPINTAKPENKKKSNKRMSSKKDEYLPYVPISAGIVFPCTYSEDFLDYFADESKQHTLMAEIAYYRGDFQKTKDCFYDIKNDAPEKFCACTMGIVAAVCTDDYSVYRDINSFLTNMDSTDDEQIKMLVSFVRSILNVSIIVPELCSDWVKNLDVFNFPKPVRYFALYVCAKYLQGERKFLELINVAKVALALCSPDEGFFLLDIYFYLLCAAGYCAIDQFDEGEIWVKKALEIALPWGFITPFAETLPIYCGVLEKVLQNEYPEWHKTIYNKWEETWKYWIMFHNEFAKDNITSILTLREQELALLLASGSSYAEASRRLNISVGRVKNIASVIYEKLYISGKSELAEFVF